MNELLSNLLQILQQVALIVFAWRLPEIIRAFKAEQAECTNKNLLTQADNVFVRMVYFYVLVSGGVILGILTGSFIAMSNADIFVVVWLSFAALVLLKMAAKVFGTFFK